MAEASELHYRLHVEARRSNVAAFVNNFHQNPATAELYLTGSQIEIAEIFTDGESSFSRGLPRIAMSSPNKFEIFYKPDGDTYLNLHLETHRAKIANERLHVVGGKLKIGRVAIEGDKGFNKRFNTDTTVKISELALRGLVTQPNRGRLVGQVAIFKTEQPKGK